MLSIYIFYKMSEATLKKKTRTQYRNMSVGSKNGGFSLNGTRRSQGYVGQTMLGRHFPSTPMRGNVARGSGGCCGTYYQGTIIQSGVCFPSNNGNTANNDPGIVKTSVLDTNGLIMTKYRWIRRPQPYTTVKPDSNMIQMTQQQYITSLSKSTIADLEKCSGTDVCKTTSNTCGNLNRFQRPRPFGSTIQYPRSWVSITKTANSSNKLKPISQSQFISALGGLCVKNDPLPKTKTNNAVLPGPAASY